MRKLLFLFFIAILSKYSITRAQSVGINDDGSLPHPSAMLDVKSLSRGVLIPRVALTATNSASPVSSPLTSLLVYNTATAGSGGIAVTPGFYFWNGASWEKISSASTPSNAWSLTGNSGTSSDNNFIGTADDQALVFKVNNVPSGIINRTHLNTAFGFSAFSNNINGTANTAFGSAAMYSNTIGYNNSAFGQQALLSNTGGGENTAIGNIALFENTTGSNNTAIGSRTLGSNTTGSYNTAVGYLANVAYGDLTNATAIGYNAQVSQSNSLVLGNTDVSVGVGTSFPNTSSLLDLTSNSKGLLIPRMTTTDRDAISSPATGLLIFDISLNSFYYYNGTSWVAVGSASGWQLNGNSGTNAANFIGTTDAQPLSFGVNNSPAGFIHPSSWNTAFGIGTLASSTGGANTAIGYTALTSNTSGANNTAIGLAALYSNTSGFNNSATGADALYGNTTGHDNTATGSFSLFVNTTGSANTADGRSALSSNTTGFDNVAIGYQSLMNNSNGADNTAVGLNSLQGNSSGQGNTAVGSGSLQDNTTGGANTAVGNHALQNNTASGNTAIGASALSSNTTGNENTALGSQALLFNTTGLGNTAVGLEALRQNTSGFDNVAIGVVALHVNTTGNANVAIGGGALGVNTEGGDNTATGDNVMVSNTTGNNNAAFGEQALKFNTSGSQNTAFGSGAFFHITTGSGNTAVGANADVSSFDDGALQNATAIGYGAIVNASNKVRIGNDNVTVIEGAVPFTTPSDGRFKFNIREDVPGLDFVLRLRPVTYQFDAKRFSAFMHGQVDNEDVTRASYDEATSVRRTGFIAQEVEKAANESGYDFSGVNKPKAATDHYSLSYESFVVPLVKAVQEQQQVIEQLKQQVETLTKIVQTLSSNK